MNALHTGHEADIAATENLELTPEQMIAIINDSVSAIPNIGDTSAFGDAVTAEDVALRLERIAKTMVIYAKQIREYHQS